METDIVCQCLHHPWPSLPLLRLVDGVDQNHLGSQKLILMTDKASPKVKFREYVTH